MVVYELERALGRFVREHSAQLDQLSTAQQIVQRVSTGTPSSGDLTRVVVENSYLGEIMALALAAGRHSSHGPRLAELDRLSTSLGLFDIRNAISHPNRPFPDCYWYRCAAIAADPSIDALGFFEVSLAFRNALEGKLEEPPEDWMHKKRWAVPTVLPSEFEHAVTGLVGRSKDVLKLERELKNPRSALIALSARGGIGKTSLLLQVVSDFCLSSEAPQYIDGVLWASFKQEKLTVGGIEYLAAPAGLAELEVILCAEANDIFGTDCGSFEELKQVLSSKRLLLCLDNLETLLRDSPASFTDFYDALPNAWKVVVTSRIPVDGAKNVPLDVLDKPGAIALARAYLHSKGAFATDSDLLERIAVGCNCNPLAVRLAIELYLAGAEIRTALERTEHDVLQFSFTNLLDRLSKLENNVLEAIFVLEQPNRSDICGALTATHDDVAEAIATLAKTSLIVRQEVSEGEAYTLGNSIRDLLRSYPRNLEVRSQTLDWVTTTRANAEQALKLQVERNVSELDLGFIPQDAAPALISTLKQLKSAVKRDDRNALVLIEGQLRQQIGAEVSSGFLQRLYGWTAYELADLVTASTHFKKAATLGDAAGEFGLLLVYHAQQKWPEMNALTKSLVDRGLADPDRVGRHHANRVWEMYLKTANFLEDFPSVFNATSDWKEKLDVLPALALARASAYRRQADLEYRRHQCSDSRLGEFLAKASRPMMKVLVSEGFTKWLVPECRKLINETAYYKRRNVRFESFREEDKMELATLLRYCLSNEASMAGISTGDVYAMLRALDPSTRLPGAPESGGAMSKSRSEYQDQGYTVAKIKYIPKSDSFPNYVFANDDAGTDYFVRVEVFENGDWNKWATVHVGMELALKHVQNDTGKALRAVECWAVTG